MTEEEFGRLKRRFGEDPNGWPAPYRQEAMAHRGDADAGRSDDLDRLILDAASAETNEVALTRKVLTRINEGPAPAGAARPWRMWTLPAAASGFAALLMVATVAGYMAAGDGPGAGPDGIEDALLAFAFGDGGIGGADLVGEFGGEPGGEEQL